MSECCPECGGTGIIITCFDDVCVGSGECFHGDGEAMCPTCEGEGEVCTPDELEEWRDDVADADNWGPVNATLTMLAASLDIEYSNLIFGEPGSRSYDDLRGTSLLGDELATEAAVCDLMETYEGLLFGYEVVRP